MKKYSIIYADPPWAYRTYSKKGQGRSAESHYPTMCIEDIKALPVGELAAKDCALFLWITFPCLCEALEVLAAWGFSYKTVAFVWVKQNRRNDDLFTGMGYWTRANAEICILATKGHPKRVDAGVEDGCVLHVHRQRAALFHEAAVRHIAAGGQVAVQVNDITDMDVLQVFCGNRSSKDLLSVFNGQHYKVKIGRASCRERV